MQHEMADPARTIADVPVVAVDRATIELWVRALTSAADAAREMRRQAGLRAWSPGEDAALRHDEDERSAQPPPVRPLSPEERDQWRDLAETADVQAISNTTTHNELHVRTGAVGERWVLEAEVVRPSAETIAQVSVSCETEEVAQQLVTELVEAGADPAPLLRLAVQATERAERHAQTAGIEREDLDTRLARTRRAISEQWSPALATRVTADPAFEALAERLHQLEDRGVPMATALGRLNQRDLSSSRVRNPAALAEWMCENLLQGIEVNASDHGANDVSSQNPISAPSDFPVAARPVPPGATEQAWSRAILEDRIWPVLRSTFSAEQLTTLQAARGYDQLIDQLVAKQTSGWKLSELLDSSPVERVMHADDPARYLGAIVARRAEHTGAPGRTGTDRTRMRGLITQAFPDDLASRVLDCSAWPFLAKRMAGVGSDEAVVQQLSQLPLDRIVTARKPAAYAAELLKRAQAAGHGEPPRRPQPGARMTNRGDAIDRSTLDDLAPTPSPAKSWASRQGHNRQPPATEQLSPIRQAQLLLAASQADRDGRLDSDAARRFEQQHPGAASADWVADVLTERGILRGTQPGQASPRPVTKYGQLDAAATLGLPDSPLYAAAAVVADFVPPMPGVEPSVGEWTLAKRMAVPDATDLESVMATLERHGAVSPPTGLMGARRPLTTPETLPDLLRRLADELTPKINGDADAAADRHAVDQHLEAAGDAERHAANDRVTDAASAGRESDTPHDTEHARLDDNLAAAERAQAAERHGSAAAAALRGSVTCTPTQPAAVSPAVKTPRVPAKPAPQPPVRQGRRR